MNLTSVDEAKQLLFEFDFLAQCILTNISFASKLEESIDETRVHIYRYLKGQAS